MFFHALSERAAFPATRVNPDAALKILFKVTVQRLNDRGIEDHQVDFLVALEGASVKIR